MHLLRADQIAYRRRIQQYLSSDKSSFTHPGRKQPLRQYDNQHRRELYPDLALLFRRKCVDNPIDRLRGICGMKRCKNQMTCLRSRDGGPNRFRIPHLSHHNDIGVLTQRRP
ncbi:hypothetical protein D3C73_1246820 [compost metagenome]